MICKMAGAFQLIPLISVIYLTSLTTSIQAQAYTPGEMPSSMIKIAVINRKFNQGDMFSGLANCSATFCLDMNGFPVASATERPNNCNCQCHGHLPAFVEWNRVRQCSNTIEGCNMIPFQSYNARTKTQDHHFLPAIHLPLLSSPSGRSGSVLNPSGAPAWHAQGITQLTDGSADCVIEKVQLLTLNGWRPLLQHQLLFDLYEANRLSYVRWLGDRTAGINLSGKIVLINLLCNSTRQTPNYCIAFRVVGTAKFNVISTVAFSGGSSPSLPVTLALRPSPGSQWLTTTRTVPSGGREDGFVNPNSPRDGPPSEHTQLGLIVGVVCGTLLVITLIGAVILWTCCWKRQKAKLVRKVQNEVLLQQRRPHAPYGRQPDYTHQNIPPHHFPPQLQETFVPTGLEAYQYQMFSPTNPFATNMIWGPASPPPPNHVLSNSRLHYYSQAGGSQDKPDGGRRLRRQDDMDSEFGSGSSGSMSRSFIVNQMQQQQQSKHLQQGSLGQDRYGTQMSGYSSQDFKSANSDDFNQNSSGANPPPSGRKKLYFSPEFFEPELMEEPPPIAEEFLNEVRKMIDLAKNRIRSRRYIPSLLVIPEADDRSSSTKRKSPTEFLSDIMEEIVDEEHKQENQQEQDYQQKLKELNNFYTNRSEYIPVQTSSSQHLPIFQMPSGEPMKHYPDPVCPQSSRSTAVEGNNSSEADDLNGDKIADTNGSAGEDSGLGSDGTPTPPAERGGSSPTRDPHSTSSYGGTMTTNSADYSHSGGSKSPQLSKPKIPPKPPGFSSTSPQADNLGTSHHMSSLVAPNIWHKAQHSPSAAHKVTSWLRGMTPDTDSGDHMTLPDTIDTNEITPPSSSAPENLLQNSTCSPLQTSASSNENEPFTNITNGSANNESDNPTLRVAVDGSTNRASKPKGILKGYSDRSAQNMKPQIHSGEPNNLTNLHDSNGATTPNGLFTGNKLTIPPSMSFPPYTHGGTESYSDNELTDPHNSNSPSDTLNWSRAQTLPYAKSLLKRTQTPDKNNYPHSLANGNHFRYSTSPLPHPKYPEGDAYSGVNNFGSLPRYFIRSSHEHHAQADDDLHGLPPPPSYADSFPLRGHPSTSNGVNLVGTHLHPRPSITQSPSLFHRASHSNGAQQPLSVSTERR